MKRVLICGATCFVANGFESLLKQNDYKVLAEKVNIQTCEDIYHPYGMLHFESVEDYYTRWDNRLVITTGCLSRSGGINPTASMLPLVDDFVENIFNKER